MKFLSPKYPDSNRDLDRQGDDFKLVKNFITLQIPPSGG